MSEQAKVGPGNGPALFNELRKQDLLFSNGATENEIERVVGQSHESLVESARALQMASPYYWHPLESRFSFLASSSLSGAGNPCFHLPCRIERATALSRFAALYADTILIRDPFEPLLHRDPTSRIDMDFLLVVCILQLLRAEIEAGIICFAPTDFTLCPSGLKKFKSVEQAYQDQLYEVNDLVLDEAFEHLQVDVANNGEYSYISIGGTERYVPHDGIDIVPFENQSRLEDTADASEEGIREAIQTWIIDPSLTDLQYRHIINWLYNVRYLTDRPIDADILHLLDDDSNVQTPKFRPQISHPLPFIDGLDTKTLLKLRKEEGEAFQVYRDRIKQLVEQDPTTEEEFQEAFHALVEPQLNQIEKAVASARKMGKRKIVDKLMFGTGVVTLGLAAGTVAPEAGPIIAALGGTKFAAELISSAHALTRDPLAARQNDFFFLWKARQKAQ